MTDCSFYYRNLCLPSCALEGSCADMCKTGRGRPLAVPILRSSRRLQRRGGFGYTEFGKVRLKRLSYASDRELRRMRPCTTRTLLLAVTAMLPASLSGEAASGHTADQAVVGPGNAAAAAVAGSSPLVRSALERLRQSLSLIQDQALREQTLDALFNPRTCIHHRSGLTPARKRAILDRLRSEGLYSDADASAFPGGALAGVFPAVAGDAQPCPQLPQAFGTAPGSNFGGHQSYPGGLAVHEGFNLSSALSLAGNYQSAYGRPGADGLPRMAPLSEPGAPEGGDLDISRDEIIAAPMWHDWAKSLVFQWNADGTEFAEFSFGGNGLSDNNGLAGDSRTGGHHILSLAEAIARGLPPRFVIVQASAHSAPTLGNEYKVVNWIRAASIIARTDPVARGLLVRDTAGQLRLPAQASGVRIDLDAAGQVNLRIEETIHNLSDADFVFSIPAVTQAQVILRSLAPRYGYDPADLARYTTRFRNPALSFLSAERVLDLYTSHGLEAVQRELDRLHAQGVL